MIDGGLGYAKRKLVEEIIRQNWNLVKLDEKKNYTYNDLLFIIQELNSQEGKPYLEGNHSINYGYEVFRRFVQLLLYRNLANYDSMVLMTSEKGCITGDSLLELPRDLIKYPKGIPLKELEGKGPLKIYSFNKNTKKLELKDCDGVEFVKEDDVYELELNNGMKIKATGDHPFLLTNGIYKQLKDIIYHPKCGKIYNKEIKKLINTDRLRIMCRPSIITGKDGYIKIDYSDRQNNETCFSKFMIESRFILQQLGNNIENKVVHHKNNNHYDNIIENLHLINSHFLHFTEHGMEKYLFTENNKFQKLKKNMSTKKKEKIKICTEKFNNLCSEFRINYCKENKEKVCNTAKLREENNINANYIKFGGIVKSIKYIGKQKVYDVVNVKDNHNFIVNGFVVSNTGKSSAAIMMARAWCQLIGIKFDPDRHIAYNNADVMNKIDKLNKFEPIICDEAVRFASSEDWAKCLDGNTKIKIKINNKIKVVYIKNLLKLINYKVQTYNIKKNKIEYQKPINTVCSGKKVLYELKLENGQKIKATNEHLFLTRKGYKKLKNLTKRDEILGIQQKLVDTLVKFYKIKSIKKLSKRKVYDILETKNHNFIANNIVVHNSQNKELKKKISQVRTKHLLFIMCFPLKVYKVEKTFLESFVNYWCMEGNTKILIKDNLGKILNYPIKKLRFLKNYKVASYNINTKDIEYVIPEKCIKTHKKSEIYELELENGKKIKCTKEHPFLTNRGYIKLENLKENDKIIMRSKNCIHCQKEFIPLKEQMKFCCIKCSDKYNNIINKEKIKDYQNNYQKINKEILKIKQHNNYLKNKPKRLENAKEYRDKNKKYINEWATLYRHKNRLLLREKDKLQWIKRKEIDSKKWVERYNNDLNFKIKINLGNDLYSWLSKIKKKKTQRTYKYIGCSVEEFIKHIELQFKPGMVWTNHGKKGWELDHIKPMCKFDLKIEEEIYKCFNYKNFQPLWAPENQSKGGKYDGN